MEARVQRVLIWMGPAMLLIWIGAFIFIAGFFPPSDPQINPEGIVNFYGEHPGLIKLGLVISMAGSALLVPWAIGISGQLKLIPGARALGDLQMVSCALLSLEFITPIGVWMACAYQYDERSADLILGIHQLGWILFMTVIWSLEVQVIAIGTAILMDRSEKPVLSRPLGYFTLWTAVLFIPAGIVLFFKDGPFAWNGLIGLYLPLTVFVVWISWLTIEVHRNLTQQVANGVEPA